MTGKRRHVSRSSFTEWSRRRQLLWDASRHVDRNSLPSNGTILAAITKGEHGGEEYDRAYLEQVRQTIY